METKPELIKSQADPYAIGQTETWRPLVVNGTATSYEISDLGRLRKGEKLKRPYRQNNRMLINLRVGGKEHHNFVLARLVWITFVGPLPSTTKLVPKDGNCENLAVANLEPKANANSNTGKRHEVEVRTMKETARDIWRAICPETEEVLKARAA